MRRSLRSRPFQLALDFGFRKLGHPHALQHHRHQAIHRLQLTPRGAIRRIRLGVDGFWIVRAATGIGTLETASCTELPLRPHIEATAVALFALQDEQRSEE